MRKMLSLALHQCGLVFTKMQQKITGFLEKESTAMYCTNPTIFYIRPCACLLVSHWYILLFDVLQLRKEFLLRHVLQVLVLTTRTAA